MAPKLSLRILGKSQNYSRPNDVLWLMTMNQTKVSSDIVSRTVPIRFFCEGNPEDRDFGGRDPIAYAREHRAEILGELVGMLIRWNQLGRPEGQQSHRLVKWARTVGGILTANGFPEFLTNRDVAAAEFDTGIDELTALAEVAMAFPDGPVHLTDNENERQRDEQTQ
jgi:hypothetical protein